MQQRQDLSSGMPDAGAHLYFVPRVGLASAPPPLPSPIPAAPSSPSCSSSSSSSSSSSTPEAKLLVSNSESVSRSSRSMRLCPGEGDEEPLLSPEDPSSSRGRGGRLHEAQPEACPRRARRSHRERCVGEGCVAVRLWQVLRLLGALLAPFPAALAGRSRVWARCRELDAFHILRVRLVDARVLIAAAGAYVLGCCRRRRCKRPCARCCRLHPTPA